MKRNMLSLSEKQEVLRNLDNGAKVTYLAKKYGIAKSTVCAIKNKKDKIITATKFGVTKRKTLKAAKMPEMEKNLYVWLCEQREKDLLVSNDMLKLKAIRISQVLNENPDFSASDGWLQRFKKRFGVTKFGAKMPAGLHFVLHQENKYSVESTTQETAPLFHKMDSNVTYSSDDMNTITTEIKVENIDVEEACEENVNMPVASIAVKVENGSEKDFSEESDSRNVTSVEAVEALDIAISWAKQNSLACDELDMLKSVREKARKKSLEENEIQR